MTVRQVRWAIWQMLYLKEPTDVDLVYIAQHVTQKLLRNEETRTQHWCKKRRKAPTRNKQVTPWN